VSRLQRTHGRSVLFLLETTALIPPYPPRMPAVRFVIDAQNEAQDEMRPAPRRRDERTRTASRRWQNMAARSYAAVHTRDIYLYGGKGKEDAVCG
jgi:hypothetical protein